VGGEGGESDAVALAHDVVAGVISLYERILYESNRALVREYRALLSEDFSKREILFGKFLGILSATHAHHICDMTYIYQNII